MRDINSDGGPAFPVIAANGLGHIADGMSLRDYFAGQALIGLCQADMSNEPYEDSPDVLARTAYTMADAMLAAREATP